jgi:hypothetical protein
LRRRGAANHAGKNCTRRPVVRRLKRLTSNVSVRNAAASNANKSARRKPTHLSAHVDDARIRGLLKCHPLQRTVGDFHGQSKSERSIRLTSGRLARRQRLQSVGRPFAGR